MTVLITGGTSGLGRETARLLARSGRVDDVVVTGRDPENAQRTAAELRVEAGSAVHGRALGLDSLADVRRFADDLADLPPLRAVVANAGVQSVSGTVVTVDGHEQTFGVNHLAHFLLVTRLLEHLRDPARIVFVASDTHDPRKPTGMPAPRYTTARELADPRSPAPGGPGVVGRRRYTTSKLCNVLTTYELARRLAAAEPARAVTVNAFDPGLMPGTGLARDFGPVATFAWHHVLPALAAVPGPNIHTVGHSAASLARLVVDPDLARTTGRYFSGRKEIRSSAASYDRALQTDLWETSVELIGGVNPGRRAARAPRA